MKQFNSVILILSLAFGLIACDPPRPGDVELIELDKPDVTVGLPTESEEGLFSVSFSWQEVANAAGYEYVLKSRDKEIANKKVGADITGATIEGLYSDSSFKLTVRAVADNKIYKNSVWSEYEFETPTVDPIDPVDPDPTHVIVKDPVLEAYLLKLGIDADADGIISFEEAAAIKAIEMGFEYADEATDANTVKDLSGLEYFESLEILDLKYHRVSDATPIEGLSSLVKLNLGENRITSLDLSGLGNLEDLRVYGTGISELDVAKTPKLRELYAQRIAVAEIDLSDCPQLEMAALNNGQLASLRAVGLANLTRLDAVENKIDELEVTGCETLSQLHLNGNRLTELTLVDLPKLMILNVYANQLTKLDVKGLPFLIQLFAFENNLSEIDLSGNEAIQQVFLSENPLRMLDLSRNPNVNMLEVIYMPELEEINLKNDYFDEWSEYYIVEGNTALKKVVTDAGAEFDLVSKLFEGTSVSVVTE